MISRMNNNIQANIARSDISRLQPAMLFDGNVYVEIPRVAINSFVFGICFCFTPLGTAVNQSPLTLYTSSLNYFRIFYNGSDKTLQGHGKTSSVQAASAICTIGTKESVIIITFNAGISNFYINGVLQGQVNTNTINFMPSPPSQAYVGLYRAGTPQIMLGCMRQIAMTRNQLTEQQIQEYPHIIPSNCYLYLPGDGNINSNWQDRIGGGESEIIDSADRCLVRGDGTIILNNEIMNP